DGASDAHRQMPDLEEVPISHLQRRKIEGRVLIPFIQACQQRFGEAATRDRMTEVIRRLAVDDGEQWRSQFGSGTDALRQVAEAVWAGGGSLEIELLGQSDDHLDFNVTRCRYAAFYRNLGLADIGGLVHCNRDHAMVDGFNADLTLQRTQTIMQGAKHCDF